MNETTWKGYVEGPRWAKLGEFLRKLAIDLSLEIKITKEKGILTETVFFEFSGSKDNINKARELIRSSIDDYNK